jgi:ElaB/YqjD/DUF883 family membrane-anchored ribosome-binding protein
MSDEMTNDQDPAGKLESSKSHVKSAADDLRAAAESKAHELRGMAEAKAAEYKGKAEQVYGDARNRALSLREEGEEYVRQNPAKAVCTALGIGFIIGIIFRP